MTQTEALKLARGKIEAAQMCHPSAVQHLLGEACDLLNKALARPEDPLSTPLPCDVKVGHVTIRKGVELRVLVARMQVLYDLAQPKEPEQEPVSLDVTIDDEEALALLRDMVVQSNGDLTSIRLVVGGGHSGYGLYVASAEYQEEGAILLVSTSPPNRKPLTDEQVKKAAPTYAVDDFLDFNAGVRFAEAAHNIKE